MQGRRTDSRRRSRSRISVLLVDDHPIVRQGVQSVLERHPNLRVVAAVGDGSTAIREAARLKPRVVVMDISMPGMNGIEATRVITEKTPETAVLILSIHSSPIVVRRAMEAGAVGYVGKDAPCEDLVQAVLAIADGQHYIGQGLAQSLLEIQKFTCHVPRRADVLTTTEQNILKLVTDGKSNLEVAATLGLSPRTVETYRLRLMRKLGVENLPSLVRYAIRHGIIPLE
jgi:two-component system NarL family response regulator